MRKTELLAPAGNYDCMIAAFNAGADAVYLAGKAFGARAFAGNFETEELINALDYAHLHGKKIYLTLNTLIKESEFRDIYEYVLPFYENGLDGVIIQDFGLISYLKDCFPKLSIHASTQMTVNHKESALFLKKLGIERVVPSRELSLEELQDIKDTGIEVETFIHGALCYCYSGQCLFSSYLGKRSGNRGKCAQPCRLPYEVTIHNELQKKGEYYPISLKDLCTINNIYKLLDMEIDSFKIEGRMKSPEYVAGVTSIYRKYMDAYYAGKKIPVSKEDMNILQGLYIRSNIQDGYLTKHNGKDMITIQNPSYQPVNEEIANDIHNKYCDNILKRKISGIVEMKIGTPIFFTVKCDETEITVQGKEVMVAQNRPLLKDDIAKRFEKTGNTPFEFSALEVKVDDNAFLPVGELNEVRRVGLAKLEQQLLASFKRADSINNMCDNAIIQEKKNTELAVLIEDYNFLDVCINIKPDILYIPFDWIYENKITDDRVTDIQRKSAIKIYYSLPRILRKRDYDYIKVLQTVLKESEVAGVLVKNLEVLSLLHDMHYQGEMITDHNLYAFNKHSKAFLEKYAKFVTLPLECNFHDLKDLNVENAEWIVYGHMPMMVSANCVKKTMGMCEKNKAKTDFDQYLTDRYKKDLPVLCNCTHCYNIIYNAVPLSLHKELHKILNIHPGSIRLELTTETVKEAKDIISYYKKAMTNQEMPQEFVLKDFTAGHFTKGAL